MPLEGKTIFITGASRGIGRAIALRCARDGAKIVVSGKTVTPHLKLLGTIYSVAEEIEEAGGHALPIQLDVRDESAIAAAAATAAEHFGGIDILVNNAGAISLADTPNTPAKRFDLMFSINVRGAFFSSQACIPYLKRATNPHILNVAPPLNLQSKWFKDHLAYTISKYGMSLCTLGMSAELAGYGIAVNSLWPRTAIATAAVEVHFPVDVFKRSRKPQIVADAAYVIFNKDSRETTGNYFIDEDVLRSAGMTDFSAYAVMPGATLATDLFLD